MENLLELVEIIDGFKEKISDNDYLNLMKNINKLNEIISSINEDDSESNESSDNSDSLSELTEESSDESDNGILEFNKEMLEVEINNFMEFRNLPDDFINSQFNIIDDAVLNHDNCTCTINRFCSDTIDDFIKCNNIQRIVLKHPLLLIIYTIHKYRDDIELAGEKTKLVIDDLRKYNIFTFDGKIKKSKKCEDYIDYLITNLLRLSHASSDRTIACLLFFYMNYIFCVDGWKIISTNQLACIGIYNKLIDSTEFKEGSEFWFKLLNIDTNIYNIMIDSYKETFEFLQ
jgi:hypothetical protein